MNPVARRILFSLAVLTWSAALLYFHTSGRIQTYLAPDFRWIAFCGGLGLAVLGLFNLMTVRQQAACGHGGDCSGHDHESGDLHPMTAVLLMVTPLILAWSWTRDGYSQHTLARKGLYDVPTPGGSSFMSLSMPPISRADIEQHQPKSPEGNYRFNLMELFFATGDVATQSAMDGLRIETEGRWIAEKNLNPNGTRMRLYRLYMTCCVADSRAIPVSLEFGRTPPVFQDHCWVRVSGVIRFPTEGGTVHPVIEVQRVLATAPPAEETLLRQ